MAYYGKHAAPIGWPEYERRYRIVVKVAPPLIRELGERLRRGERITLLCSSTCIDPARCHRTLLVAIVACGAV